MFEFIQFIVIILMLLGSAFYSGLETGVVSVNRLRLSHMLRKKVPHADLLHGFLEAPDHLLGTTLVGNNICNVVAAVTAVSLGLQMMGRVGCVAAYVMVTVAMLIFGEYLPKVWFQSNPAERTLPFMPLLHWNGRIFLPVSRLMTSLAEMLIPIPGVKDRRVQPFITKEELEYLAHESELSGSLSEAEGRMIHRVFQLSDKTCREVMIPREDIIFVDSEASVEDIIRIAREHGVTRLPVYSQEDERFIGQVFVFDVFSDKRSEDKKAQHYLRSPQFVSADTPADDVLPRMRRSQQPMMLVTDEHVDVVGLITVEDVLEEIVGPL